MCEHVLFIVSTRLTWHFLRIYKSKYKCGIAISPVCRLTNGFCLLKLSVTADNKATIMTKQKRNTNLIEKTANNTTIRVQIKAGRFQKRERVRDREVEGRVRRVPCKCPVVTGVPLLARTFRNVHGRVDDGQYSWAARPCALALLLSR